MIGPSGEGVRRRPQVRIPLTSDRAAPKRPQHTDITVGGSSAPQGKRRPRYGSEPDTLLRWFAVVVGLVVVSVVVMYVSVGRVWPPWSTQIGLVEPVPSGKSTSSGLRRLVTQPSHAPPTKRSEPHATASPPRRRAATSTFPVDPLLVSAAMQSLLALKGGVTVPRYSCPEGTATHGGHGFDCRREHVLFATAWSPSFLEYSAVVVEGNRTVALPFALPTPAYHVLEVNLASGDEYPGMYALPEYHTPVAHLPRVLSGDGPVTRTRLMSAHDQVYGLLDMFPRVQWTSVGYADVMLREQSHMSPDGPGPSAAVTGLANIPWTAMAALHGNSNSTTGPPTTTTTHSPSSASSSGTTGCQVMRCRQESSAQSSHLMLTGRGAAAPSGPVDVVLDNTNNNNNNNNNNNMLLPSAGVSDAGVQWLYASTDRADWVVVREPAGTVDRLLQAGALAGLEQQYCHLQRPARAPGQRSGVPVESTVSGSDLTEAATRPSQHAGSTGRSEDALSNGSEPCRLPGSASVFGSFQLQLDRDSDGADDGWDRRAGGPLDRFSDPPSDPSSISRGASLTEGLLALPMVRMAQVLALGKETTVFLDRSVSPDGTAARLARALLEATCYRAGMQCHIVALSAFSDAAVQPVAAETTTHSVGEHHPNAPPPDAPAAPSDTPPDPTAPSRAPNHLPDPSAPRTAQHPDPARPHTAPDAAKGGAMVVGFRVLLVSDAARPVLQMDSTPGTHHVSELRMQPAYTLAGWVDADLLALSVATMPAGASEWPVHLTAQYAAPVLRAGTATRAGTAAVTVTSCFSSPQGFCAQPIASPSHHVGVIAARLPRVYQSHAAVDTPSPNAFRWRAGDQPDPWATRRFLGQPSIVPPSGPRVGWAAALGLHVRARRLLLQAYTRNYLQDTMWVAHKMRLLADDTPATPPPAHRPRSLELWQALTEVQSALDAGSAEYAGDDTPGELTTAPLRHGRVSVTGLRSAEHVQTAGASRAYLRWVSALAERLSRDRTDDWIARVYASWHRRVLGVERLGVGAGTGGDGTRAYRDSVLSAFPHDLCVSRERWHEFRGFSRDAHHVWSSTAYLSVGLGATKGGSGAIGLVQRELGGVRGVEGATGSLAAWWEQQHGAPPTVQVHIHLPTAPADACEQWQVHVCDTRVVRYGSSASVAQLVQSAVCASHQHATPASPTDPSDSDAEVGPSDAYSDGSSGTDGVGSANQHGVPSPTDIADGDSTTLGSQTTTDLAPRWSVFGECTRHPADSSSQRQALVPFYPFQHFLSAVQGCVSTAVAEQLWRCGAEWGDPRLPAAAYAHLPVCTQWDRQDHAIPPTSPQQAVARQSARDTATFLRQNSGWTPLLSMRWDGGVGLAQQAAASRLRAPGQTDRCEMGCGSLAFGWQQRCVEAGLRAVDPTHTPPSALHAVASMLDAVHFTSSGRNKGCAWPVSASAALWQESLLAHECPHLRGGLYCPEATLYSIRHLLEGRGAFYRLMPVWMRWMVPSSAVPIATTDPDPLPTAHAEDPDAPAAAHSRQPDPLPAVSDADGNPAPAHSLCPADWPSLWAQLTRSLQALRALLLLDSLSERDTHSVHWAAVRQLLRYQSHLRQEGNAQAAAVCLQPVCQYALKAARHHGCLRGQSGGRPAAAAAADSPSSGTHTGTQPRTPHSPDSPSSGTHTGTQPHTPHSPAPPRVVCSVERPGSEPLLRALTVCAAPLDMPWLGLRASQVLSDHWQERAGVAARVFTEWPSADGGDMVMQVAHGVEQRLAGRRRTAMARVQFYSQADSLQSPDATSTAHTSPGSGGGGGGSGGGGGGGGGARVLFPGEPDSGGIQVQECRAALIDLVDGRKQAGYDQVRGDAEPGDATAHSTVDQHRQEWRDTGGRELTQPPHDGWSADACRQHQVQPVTRCAEAWDGWAGLLGHTSLTHSTVAAVSWLAVSPGDSHQGSSADSHVQLTPSYLVLSQRPEMALVDADAGHVTVRALSRSAPDDCSLLSDLCRVWSRLPADRMCQSPSQSEPQQSVDSDSPVRDSDARVRVFQVTCSAGLGLGQRRLCQLLAPNALHAVWVRGGGHRRGARVYVQRVMEAGVHGQEQVQQSHQAVRAGAVWSVVRVGALGRLGWPSWVVVGPTAEPAPTHLTATKEYTHEEYSHPATHARHTAAVRDMLEDMGLRVVGWYTVRPVHSTVPEASGGLFEDYWGPVLV